MSFQISMPIIVEKLQPEGERAYYRARTIFFSAHVRLDQREDRAIRLLRDELRRELEEIAKQVKHTELALCSFHPPLSHRRIDLALTLRRRTLRTHLFLIIFESLGRKLVASPQIPEVTFELMSGESLESRAQEVYTEFFKKLERKNEDLSEYQFTELVYSHLDTLTFDIGGKQKLAPPNQDRPLAFLGMQQEMSGSQELERTGRCLNRLYPNDLQQALSRDEELSQLIKWFDRNPGTPPMPIVIVGPSQVGKTTLIHEWVRHNCTKDSHKWKTWLLSPQRLISGMSYLGQWEERVIAILEHAAKEKLVLYFDDLIGLFHAGKSRDSNLTVGQVLKLHLEESKLRVIAEATPAAWRKLREVDRSFADLFTVIHLREPAEIETLKILIRTIQDLEQRHGCKFAPDVLPLIMELPRRFVRGRAFPGKGSEMLRQLAATHPDADIAKEQVYQFFQNKTGIRQQFMDRREVMQTEGVELFFRKRIVGQDEAIQAMVDAIVMAKAQLNDPDRPVASLLFLGPTGVGKTECAKALAEYYFGSADRLLRFDMNEFNGWDAIPRLIGSFGGRQGVLTGAVRRKPHGVILLDEIEKANPNVFDLLLQVLDDGRLTDANGVTADFCNAIIILTSNLGARDARTQLGFESSTKENTEVYREAAQKFFRPEFFNRLDRVVAFHELGKEHIQGIVKNLVNKAMHRQGLYQRQLTLSLDREVYDLLSDLGFQREYGARALRRAVEDHLMEPLSIQLANTKGRYPAFLRAAVRDGGIHLALHQLSAAPRKAPIPPRIRPEAAIALARTSNQFVQRIDVDMDNWRESDDEHLSQSDQHYYLVREELISVRQAREKLQTVADSAVSYDTGRRPATRPTRHGRQPKMLYVPNQDSGALLDEIFSSPDSGVFFDHLGEEATVLDGISHQSNQLVQHASRIQYLANPGLARPDRMIIRFHLNQSEWKGEDMEDRFQLYKHWIESYIHVFQKAPAVSMSVLRYDPEEDRLERNNSYAISNFVSSPTYWLYGEGPGFLDLLKQEQGMELFCFSGQSFEYGGVDVFELTPEESVHQAARRVAAVDNDLMESTTEVFRVRHEDGWVLDLKTGILTRNPKVQLWHFLMPLLPRPEEFQD